MRVLICGGRTYEDYQHVCDFMSDFCVERGLIDNEYLMPTGLTVIHGKQRGADMLGDKWAVHNGVPIEEYEADWDRYKKAAGFIRNKRMLDTGIDVVVAFPGGPGTENMKKIARKAGVEVIEA